MAESDSSQLSEKLKKATIIDVKPVKESEKPAETDFPQYGLPLKEVYRLAYNFYREKEGKAVHFTYEDKLQLVAFSQQAAHGPLAAALERLPPLGALDVVGRDRRLAWQRLGALAADEARAGFVELLARRCALLPAYLEAHRRELRERERRAAEAQRRRAAETQAALAACAEQARAEALRLGEEAARRQVQQALNAQTFDQFRAYAEAHFPGDTEKQGALVRQLQEQHYVQYVQQLQAAQQVDEQSEVDANDSQDEQAEGALVAASMWTRSDLAAFKQTVAQAEGDGVVRVGHGETVTVRVPTHADGSRLFWEFATDYYDIGFGVYFEFGTPTTTQVSVHVSESDEEDLDDVEEDPYDDETIQTGDLEAGSVAINGVAKPLLTEIVPVYRRDCQNEVYAGSHQYPGQGVYLLKFDNSYSLWRSKTLYYRVYYTQ